MIREIAPPKGADRIEWYLLTTAMVTTLAEAEQMIRNYTLRWRVEDIFRILTRGCRVEGCGFSRQTCCTGGLRCTWSRHGGSC